MSVAYCWRNGVIEIGRRAPRGSLKLVTAPGRTLRPVVDVVARHAYDGKSLLVPGIPEARSDLEALEAAKSFQEQVARRLAARGDAASGEVSL